MYEISSIRLSTALVFDIERTRDSELIVSSLAGALRFLRRFPTGERKTRSSSDVFKGNSKVRTSAN